MSTDRLMRISPALTLALLALLALLTACPGSLDNAEAFRDAAGSPDTAPLDTGEGDTGETAEPQCTPETILEDLFVPTCGNDVACHGTFAANGLNLTQPDPASRVFGVESTCNDRPLAIAGDPDASFLYEKLVSPSPECGVKMPVGIVLTQEQLDCVRDWIESHP